ncbi:hypothetical protein [Paracoccus indicus]|uniref:hypothetical protein n=1 Tax=Paracoccus indicus TaxID=2079229 RepID=UPI000D352C78|nr:hypothetical protein [Paracoccus indicus]
MMEDTMAMQKLKGAVRQELKDEATADTDKARYEDANAVLLDAVDCGGGFADMLADFLKNIESNPMLELIRKADPENRAALLEVLGSYRRFGLSPQVAARFKDPHSF